MSECECGASLNSQDELLCQKCLAENDIDSDGWDAVFDKMELLEDENKKLKEFRWIWCKDELPEEGSDNILVKVDCDEGESYFLDIAFFVTNNVWSFSNLTLIKDKSSTVTQWLKAPEPMEEKG